MSVLLPHSSSSSRSRRTGYGFGTSIVVSGWSSSHFRCAVSRSRFGRLRSGRVRTKQHDSPRIIVAHLGCVLRPGAPAHVYRSVHDGTLDGFAHRCRAGFIVRRWPAPKQGVAAASTRSVRHQPDPGHRGARHRPYGQHPDPDRTLRCRGRFRDTLLIAAEYHRHRDHQLRSASFSWVRQRPPSTADKQIGSKRS